ncbi:MAG: nucleotidyltransferase family protein [Clostridia bacterium]|nr:nucleotidyltransferase family protein [Clostridia bacterium]
MRICAVICEFNPFHFGHEYIVTEAKKHNDAVIAVMSGAFTQRGETAILSKYERAIMAIEGGCDLVLELPFPFCSAGAEKFAHGGIGVINGIGCIDELVFGSECADAEEIKKVSGNLLTDRFITALNGAKGRNADVRYADMYFGTYRNEFGATPVFDGSNDILAVNYVSELIRLNSKTEIRPIKRVGKSYNGIGNGISSATEIRKRIIDGTVSRDDVPEYTAEIIAGNIDKIYDYSRMFAPFASYFRLHGAADFSSCYDMTDELAYRIGNAFDKSTDINTSIEYASNRNYSGSRVRRAMLNAILSMYESDYRSVEYTAVLAANKTGREILANIRKTSAIPIITKPADYKSFGEAVSAQFELSLRADALASLCRVSPCRPSDVLTRSPYMK